MELSYFETLQMINLTIDRLDSLFEFWLSATFAAIVAGHLAGEKMTKLCGNAYKYLSAFHVLSVG